MSVTIRDRSFESTQADFLKGLDVIRMLWEGQAAGQETPRQVLMADMKWKGGLWVCSLWVLLYRSLF